MSDMYDWEHCDHKGIGNIGCPTCDPDKGRVMIRLQRLDNRALRAREAALLVSFDEMLAALERRCVLCCEGVELLKGGDHFRAREPDPDGTRRGLRDPCGLSPDERTAIARARAVRAAK